MPCCPAAQLTGKGSDFVVDMDEELLHLAKAPGAPNKGGEDDGTKFRDVVMSWLRYGECYYILR